MDWNPATVWWIAAGVLVAAELASGTFYLLMLALGAAAGALTAHLGVDSTGQVLAAAVVGGASIIGWHLKRSRMLAAAPASSNPDVNLDIGQSVQVESWSSEGLAKVQYRGAAWQARFIGNAPAQTGRHVIRAVEGSCLLLDR
ncbi:MAG: NfeD family protein [Oxalobacteraceae bacterium]|nr:MAG: NfeD family protein [Oxalobacteraceae bacterium]